MILCNHCSVAFKCPLFRDGQVCTVPDSDGSKLIKHFGSKDPETVIDGLLKVAEIQADRLERGLKSEESSGELDPEVTKIADGLFKKGIDIAKLRAPKAPLVAIQNNVAQPAQIQPVQDKHQIVAGAVKALEAAGIAREDQTEEQLEYYIEHGRAPLAIEGVGELIDTDVIDVTPERGEDEVTGDDL